jgi:hypothetical protein
MAEENIVYENETGTRPVATTRKQGESKQQQRMRAKGLTPKLMQQAFDQQQDLMRLAQQGQVNPITGTRTITRRDMSGNIVDPNAPTGLAWLEAYGPQRESVAQRQEALDAQLITPEDIQGGRSAVSALRQQQEEAGMRTAFDNSEVPVSRRRVEQTPGSDVRVAYDDRGMPVGFTGVTAMAPVDLENPNVYDLKTRRPVKFGAPIPTTGAGQGGFSDAERAAINRTAIDLAASQSAARMNQAFEPTVEVGPLEPVNTTSPVDSLGNFNPNYIPPATPNISQRALNRVGNFFANIVPTSLQDYFRAFGYENTMKAGTPPTPTAAATTRSRAQNVDEYGYPIPSNQ